jgi:hypothetical protein
MKTSIACQEDSTSEEIATYLGGAHDGRLGKRFCFLKIGMLDLTLVFNHGMDIFHRRSNRCFSQPTNAQGCPPKVNFLSI